jgi:hypothetical protein
MKEQEQSPVDVDVIRKCVHCGCSIKHYWGRLWHEVGAKVFPQYCVNFSGYADKLHEPMELQSNAEGSPVD